MAGIGVSVYGTWLAIDGDEHEDRCAAYVEDPPRSRIFNLSGKPCDCTAQRDKPIIYQGSHVVPNDDDPRGGFVLVCAVPAFCHPDADRSGPVEDYSHPVDFLRLYVREDPTTYHGGEPGDATVVLDKRHVVELRDTLTAWLERDGDAL